MQRSVQLPGPPSQHQAPASVSAPWSTVADLPFSEAVRVDNMLYLSAFGANGLALGAAVEVECWATVG